MTELNRRGLIGLAIAAPAIVSASSLMKLWIPPHILYMDGIRDDADALNAWARGKRVLMSDGRPAPRDIVGKTIIFGSTLYFNDCVPGTFDRCTFIWAPDGQKPKNGVSRDLSREITRIGWPL